MEPYYVRVQAGPTAPRRARLAVVRRVRLRLAAVRRRQVEVWAWTALLVWVASPLQTFLSGVDPALPSASQDGTPLYRYARYAACAAPLLVAARQPERLLRLLRAAWPMLLLLAYALASLGWSQDRDTSTKAVLSGAPMLLCALGVGLALRPIERLQAIHRALAAAVMGSVAAVALLPHYAVAGAHDVVGASAPGDWRGLYGHKNTLGHIAALAVVLFARPGARRHGLGGARPVALAAALACLVGSRCASGLLIASVGVIASRLPRRGAAWPFAALGFLSAALAAAFAGRALILAAAFSAVGRDPTLSGRTLIWRDALALAGRHKLFGWGLDYAVSPPVALRLTRLFGVDHVHNAGLDLYFSLGAVGLALATLAVGWAVRRVGMTPTAGPLRAMIGCWLLSGLTEDMGVRTEGPMALFGLCALFGLYALRSGRGRFRRPRFAFAPAWTAPLRPPRLKAAA